MQAAVAVPEALPTGAEKTGEKRKSPWVPPPKGTKRMRKYIPHSKTPALVLKEHFAIKGGWKDEMIEEMSPDGDCYVFCVKINGVGFYGKAKAKKVALQAACECALRHSGILSDKEASEVIWLMPPPPPVIDDLHEEQKLTLRTLTVPEMTKTHFAQQARVCHVSRLRRMAPEATFDVTENPARAPQKKTDDSDFSANDVEMKDTEGEVPSEKKKVGPKYTCVVTIPSYGEYKAGARSKTLAKQRAAFLALTRAYQLELPAPGKPSAPATLGVSVGKSNVGLFGGSPTKKMKMSPVAPMVTKMEGVCPVADPCATPAFILNVKMPGLKFEYDVELNGLKSCKCVVDGLEFVGCGNSKKEAKQETCRKILSVVFNMVVDQPAVVKQEFIMPSVPVKQEFIMPSVPVKQEFGLLGTPKKSKPKAPSNPQDEPEAFLAYAAQKVNAITAPKNPVALVSEVYRNVAQFEDLTAFDEKGMPVGQFQIALKIFGRQFFGSGTNKKMAKTGACRAALAALHGMSFSPVNGNCVPLGNVDLDFASDDAILGEDAVMFDGPVSDIPEAPALPNYPRATAKLLLKQSVADAIADAVRSKFKEVTANDEVAQKRKVLAGIVMTIGDVTGSDFDAHNPANYKVICVTSGTKCVSGGALGLVGDVVQDCHAEIVAKRCMRLYLMEEMIETMNGAGSIFDKTMGGIFRFKGDFKFHLFVSSAPCGDARIYCVQEHVAEMADTGYGRKNRGLLRTKIESGEGTLPISAEGARQTYDAIVIGGERMLTMSCSDKLCRWNVTGIQGALLSQLLDKPIYFSSVVLGSLFQPEHMERALIDRVSANLDDLPSGYVLNKPLMGVCSSPESRTLVKSPNHSVNWIEGFAHMEVLNATSGKVQLTAGATSAPPEASRLCKASLFAKWSEVWTQVTGCQPLLVYGSAKSLAYSYQDAKEAANQSLFNGGFSRWVKKPPEVDSFGRE